MDASNPAAAPPSKGESGHIEVSARVYCGECKKELAGLTRRMSIMELCLHSGTILFCERPYVEPCCFRAGVIVSTIIEKIGEASGQK